MAGGGRSYEMDPETADPTSRSRSKMREYTEKVSKDMADKKVPDDDKISYGRKFAQTEEHYIARQMNHELEELAREDGALDDEDEKRNKRGQGAKKAAEPSGGAKKEAKSSREKPTKMKMEDVGRTSPIGAMPAATEPPPREAFGELMTDAARYSGMIRDAMRDIFTAGMRLARLPVEVAIIAAARIRPLRT